MTVQTTRIDIGNATYQWAGDFQFIRDVAQGEVAAFVEARDADNDPIPVRKVLGPGWRVVQDTRNGATAGAALAVRRGTGIKVSRVRTWLASRAAQKVQARRAVQAVLLQKTRTHLYETHVIVVHQPLVSTGQQDDATREIHERVRVVKRRREIHERVRVVKRRREIHERVRVVKRRREAVQRPSFRRGLRRGARVGLSVKPARTRVVRWVVLGDFNASHSVMRDRLGGAHSVGVDVMGAIFSAGWDVSSSSRHLPGSDHGVLTIQSKEK